MAFMIYATDDGRIPAWEYYEATGATPKVGMAMNLASGKLALASGVTKPDFICMREHGKAAVEGELIPVIAVTAGLVVECPCTGVAVGDTISINSDGVTAAKGTDGAGKVIAIPATGYARVRF